MLWCWEKKLSSEENPIKVILLIFSQKVPHFFRDFRPPWSLCWHFVLKIRQHYLV